MDYQYIKSIVSEIYKDLPGKFNFPPECMDEVRQYCLDDSFLATGVSGVLTYFSSSEQGRPVVVYAKTAKKSTAKSVGYYSQCLGWSWTKELPQNIAEEVFGSVFMEENELDTYCAQNMEVPKIVKHVEPKEIEISTDAIRAVLYGVMSRWLVGNAPVRIAVPENEAYDPYVLSAVQSLYAYFPMALRMRAGFCSYLPAGQTVRKKIFIGFIPESAADDSTIFLDGRSSSAYRKYISVGTGVKSIDRFIEHLSHLQPSDRYTFLDGIYEDVEGSGDPQKIISVSVEAYDSVGKMLAYMDEEKSVSTLLPFWLDFLSGQERFPANMRCELTDHIGKRLTAEEISAYAVERFSSDETPEKLMENAKVFEPVCTVFPQFTEEIHNVLMRQLSRFSMTTENEFALLEKHADFLPHIIFRNDLADLKVQILREECERIDALPCDLPSQIDSALEALGRLLDGIKPYTDCASGESFDVEVRTQIAELEERKNSADALYNEILQEMQTAGAYFSKLERFSEKENRLKVLEDNQQWQLKRMLQNTRPTSFSEYKAEYCRHFGKQLTLQSLSGLGGSLCQHIVDDLCSFEELTARYERGISAGKFNEKIIEARAVGNFVKEACRVRVTGLPGNLSESDARQLMELNFDDLRAEKKTELKEALFGFVGQGLYSGKDLTAICRFLCDEGTGKISEEDAATLLNYIDGERFRNSTESDYWLAYEALFTNLQSKKPLERLDVLRKQIRRNADAETTLSNFIKVRTPKKNRGKAVVVSLSVAAAVLCLSTAGLGFLWHRSSSALKAEKLSVETLLRAAEDSFDIALFNHEFDTYRAIFKDLLSDSENLAVLDEIYRSKDFLEEIAIGGYKTTWAELFFWNCVYAANEERVTPESFEAARDQAECAALLVSSTKPVSEALSPEKQQEQTEGEDELAGELASPEEQIILQSPDAVVETPSEETQFDAEVDQTLPESAEEETTETEALDNLEQTENNASMVESMGEPEETIAQEQQTTQPESESLLKEDAEKILQIAEKSFLRSRDLIAGR